MRSIIRNNVGWLIMVLSILSAQNTVCFEIESNPNSNAPGLGEFTKYVNVLDVIGIYAESSISDAKVLHAAAVAAQLLDNDEDGVIDDQALQSVLQSADAAMPIFTSEWSSAADDMMDNFTGCASAALFNNEIDPSATGYWGSDASVEEILHTINHCGHVELYPSAFGLQPNSSLLTAAMDAARGGQFINHPGTYPDDAWYHYDDTTCDYECMAIEYLYWAIVTNMGILADEATCSGIANEWEPCTPELLQSTDTLIYNLITDTTYQLPQLAPDGNYCPPEAGVDNASVPENFELFPAYPNPFNPTTTLRYDLPEATKVIIMIYDLMGRDIKTLVNHQQKAGYKSVVWDATNDLGEPVSAGIYLYRISAGDFHQTKKMVLLK